ncbi:MAG: TldD/PmbA family protein [Gudongella sp.]|nr:TldD/PmbA family protein [Gudongella sp.]
MDFNAFSSLVFAKGKYRLNEMEIFYSSRKTLKIEVFNQKVDNYVVSDTEGVALRGVGSDGVGHSYTERLDEESAEMIVEEACQNGKFTDSNERPLFPKRYDYPGVVRKKPDEMKEFQTEEKISMMLNLENEALKLDSRVGKIQMCIYEDSHTVRRLKNSKGLDLEEGSSMGYVYLSVVAKQDEDISTGSSFRVFKNPKKIQIEKIAREAVEEAVSFLYARPVGSGNYGAVIRNRVFVDILEGFIPAFSGLNAQRGLSFLMGKEGDLIGSPEITIIEDPFMEEGHCSCDFDDEGYKTTKKIIVEEGRLNGLLYDSVSSGNIGSSSTGNGFRSSIKETIGIRPTNLLVEKGTRELNKIIEEMDSGIFITEVAGLHSGLDSVSGDFSLQAQGFEIVEGTLGRPIKGITISGNLIQLLKGVEEVSDDILFGIPGDGCFGAPSIKINSISVSGD